MANVISPRSLSFRAEGEESPDFARPRSLAGARDDKSAGRREFLKGAALIVGFTWTGAGRAQQSATPATPATPSSLATRPTPAAPAAARTLAVPGITDHTLDTSEVDAFLAIRKNGTVVIYSGKVDLGTGHRIAMRQMVGEELNLRPQDIAAIELIEGDTALTPDQGPTAGSTGVMRGGVQLRQAAATAREALLGMAAQKLNRPAAELTLEAGAVTAGTQKLTIAELVGDRTFNTKLDPKAPLKNPQRYTVVGQSLPRPDIPAKMTGRFTYVHDFKLPNMLHARVIRPAAVGAKLLEVDEASVKHIPGARVVRQQNFLAVVAPDEWAAVRAAKALKARWSEGPGLVGHEGVKDWALKGPFAKEELTTSKGSANALAEAATAPGTRVVKASFVWPVQSHASMGPSAAASSWPFMP